MKEEKSPDTAGSLQKVDKGPPIEASTVKAYVGACHARIDEAKQLLEEHPGLLNASWDWGGGDFESGLEGAGHMGNVEIAEFLLSKGARMNIFCAAMLGHLDYVKAALTAYPSLKDSKGPHGITLIRHAEAGGERAMAVLEYVRKLG